jgi:hypothetical protein
MSSLVHSLATPTPPPDRGESIETALLDADGMALCHAVAAIASEPGIVDLSNLDEPDQLFTYYFAQGGRKVVLPLHDAVVEGWLETQWGTTGRQWWLELD